MKRQLKNIIVGIAAFFAVALFVQCDSTTAEEYKAQAIEYAESGEHEKAAEAYLKAAEKGDAEAQYMIGCLYFTGEHMPNNPYSKNNQQALKWLEKSAKQGYVDAMCVAGMAALKISPAENVQQAIDFWCKAEQEGDGLSAYFLGDIYSNDEIIPSDFNEAIIHFKKAYSQNVIAGGLRLAQLYVLDTDTYEQGLSLIKEVNAKSEQLGLDPFVPDQLLQYEFLNKFKKCQI